MNAVPATRHLLRAKDLADARYPDPLDVPSLARAAHLSPAHFSREFRRTFGETPHQYLLTRRLERAAALLRNTDRPIVEICLAVGLRSIGSFTTSFGRAYGLAERLSGRPSPGRGPGPNPHVRPARMGPSALQQFSRRQLRRASLTSRPSVQRTGGSPC